MSKKDLILKSEVVEYTTKSGDTRETINYYVEIDTGLMVLKVQLRPIDFTGRELLNSTVRNK